MDLQETLQYMLNLTNEQKLEIAAKSYYHSNHFYKVVLREFEDGSKVRIHYWNKLDNFVQNAHNHGWAFTSCILRGALRDTVLEEVEGDEYEKYIMDLSFVDDRYHSYLDKRTGLAVANDRIFKQGDTYGYDTATVHTSLPEEEGTITLLFQAPQTTTSNLIYKSSVGQFETEKHHRFLTLDEVNFVVNQTLDCLTAITH